MSLADTAAKLRENVPPQFQPKEDASLRSLFSVTEEAPAPALDIEPEIFEIEEIVAAPVAPAPVTPVKAPEDDKDEDADFEPELAEDAASFNVVDTPGESDSHEHALDVAAVHEEAREMQERLDKLAQKAVSDGRDFDGSINGFRSSVSWVNARQGENAEKKRKEADDKFTQSMLKKMLEDSLNWLYGERDRINERLEQIEQRVDQIDQSMQALDELDELQQAGQLDPNNPAHAALLRRAGIDPAQVTRDNAGEMLSRQRWTLQEEMMRLGREQEALRLRLQEIQRQIDQAEDLKRRYEANPNDPAIQREIRELERTVEGQRKLDRTVSLQEEAAAEKTLEARNYNQDEIDRALASKSQESGESMDSFSLDDEETIAAAPITHASTVNDSGLNAPDMQQHFAAVSRPIDSPTIAHNDDLKLGESRPAILGYV